MKDKITPAIFQRLVELAALSLEPEEARYLRKELNNQLVSVEILENIPIDEDVEAAPHGVPYPEERSPAMRKDEIIPSKDREAILGQAPELEDDYFVVPDISQEELE